MTKSSARFSLETMHIRGTRCRNAGILLVWMASLLPAGKIHADEPPPSHSTTTATSSDRTSPPQTSSTGTSGKGAQTGTAAAATPAEDADLERQRQRQIAIGLFLLVGIALAWMLGFALLWGWRTRRILRQPLPEAPRGDELWYLKKPMPGTPPSAENAPGGKPTESQSDKPPPNPSNPNDTLPPRDQP